MIPFSKDSPRNTFANVMDGFLNVLELDSDKEDPSGTAKIECATNARDKLMPTLKEAEDQEMGGGYAVSQCFDASDTTGKTGVHLMVGLNHLNHLNHLGHLGVVLMLKLEEVIGQVALQMKVVSLLLLGMFA